jgi:hypothetical protein
METDKQFSGGCLNCNFETTDRNELKAHNCNAITKAKREWNSNQCEKCAQPLRDCLCEMATVEEVLGELETTAPKNWWVSLEYPNFIAVSHPTFNDEQLIALGDINGYFSFNDGIANPVAGSMEELTDADEIAESFWQQIAEIYPELVKGE